MYFKGLWLQPFLPQSTRPGLFFTSHFEYQLVDMMVTMTLSLMLVLALPKFQLEDSFQLSTALLKLGFRDLVTGNVNLTGFTQERLLDIDAVYHKARIAVDEQGTETSAATATAFPRHAHSTKILDFIVDRPFVFL
ncbi:leukocyte elastase inhibitor C [Caerostris extrusa]|uniref:Leukocyte elastase inhibitor C n=1 Tax=Caerostris extrusa TaxID=172846 RepID=A0AAV4WK26_CAEEX|nr:leukocyte elastase inhibitor C [Caerostris extrusa]